VTLPPIHREILVDASPDTAFALFTEKIGDWWPVASHSVFGAGATVAFEGETLVERSPGGEACEWGQVTDWQPPGEFTMTWHPGRETMAPSQVTVRFRVAGDQTLVVLEHSGWDMFADQAEAARAEYDQGWPAVLRLYQEFATPEEPSASPSEKARSIVLSEADGGAGDGDGDGDGEVTWVALVHRPGPAADPDVPVFAQPQFRLHAEFLQRMAGQGYLVAAGPLDDEAGTGMTVLRLPGADQLAEATRLATEDDASVAGGFFTVTVRPWQVMMTAAALES
jgi:uncharacterized protein YciI/uncharacterized protein YndB with AHSA1/START domain